MSEGCSERQGIRIVAVRFGCSGSERSGGTSSGLGRVQGQTWMASIVVPVGYGAPRLCTARYRDSVIPQDSTALLGLDSHIQDPRVSIGSRSLSAQAMSRYGDSFLSPNSTPSKLSKGQKSRARREPSGVFSLFQAPQIQQFKEAFQLIDHDKDGWVGESDLKEIFTSLGGLHLG